jgi:type II secretory pathway component PulJ
MELVKNEKGVTLIEVLAAIVILMIILGSVMNFFPQIGFVNKSNEEKAEAINTAKLILHNWQNDSNVKNFLKTPSDTAALTYQPQSITD